MSGVDLVMAAAVVLLSRRGGRSSQADFVHPFYELVSLGCIPEQLPLKCAAVLNKQSVRL